MVNSLDFVKFWNDGVTNAGAGGRVYSAEKIAQLEQYMRDPSISIRGQNCNQDSLLMQLLKILNWDWVIQTILTCITRISVLSRATI